MKTEIINMIVTSIVSIATTLVLGCVIPYIKSKVGTEKFAQISSWVDIFVRCAEQIFTTATGEEKLAQVMEWSEAKLKDIGVTLSIEDIRALIEDSVQKMNEIKTYDIIDDADVEYINCLGDNCDCDDEDEEAIDV